jgi:hypothetical protein
LRVTITSGFFVFAIDSQLQKLGAVPPRKRRFSPL